MDLPAPKECTAIHPHEQVLEKGKYEGFGGIIGHSLWTNAKSLWTKKHYDLPVRVGAFGFRQLIEFWLWLSHSQLGGC